MGKVKATLVHTSVGAAAAAAPITGTEPLGAEAPVPAIVVFGRDDKGKAHASWFAAADAELAIRAAGLMRMQVLPLTTDEHRAAALQLAAGKIFESGRGFVPFSKEAAYTALAAFEGAYVPPMPVEPEPEGVVAATNVPATWTEFVVGSLVLASAGHDDEGWWPAIITADRGEDIFTLRWQGYDEDPEFVRRRADLGLIALSTVIKPVVTEAAPEEPDSAPA